MGDSTFNTTEGMPMIPDELRHFRPYSQQEVDREMDASFLRREQHEDDERAARLEQLKLDATGAASHEGYSPRGDGGEPAEIPEDEERMLDELAGLSPTLAGHGMAAAPTEATHRADDTPPPTPIERTTSDAMPVAASAEASAVVLAAADASAGLDRFPVANLDAVPACDDPGRELAALFRELVLHKNYAAVRTRCCQLSIRMNLLGAVAPAFRDWPRGVAAYRSKIGTLIMRDQMVIDYHWCHASGMSLSPTDDVHKHLLDLDTVFDFTTAWRLSGKLHRSVYRAGEALCLTPLQQCQTIQLHGRELHERMESMYKGYLKSSAKSHSELAKATAAIGQWIDTDPRIKPHRVSYLRLWQARELLGPGASKQSIAELHALMLGAQPLDRKTITDKLIRLSKNVPITPKPATTP